MTTSELTSRIKQHALDTGFTKVGVTSADAFDEPSRHLSEWVSSGNHGLMSYMERNHDKRHDVRLIFPEAKSILSLALNYYHPDPQPEENKISRYAWGDDYHDIIWEKLESLLTSIKELVPEAEGRYYCDTGPIMEKAVAERAGIGWIGKHTNVITREVGSWVFLAEILLNIDLEADTPAEDMCGTCTSCIDACPTEAITPYQVNATKCISYLTIELKPEHEIPVELHKKFDGWLYGCDICQDVCPWNRFGKETDDHRFAPRKENIGLPKEKIESMEQEDFSKRFHRSPVKRTKLAGLKRNNKLS